MGVSNLHKVQKREGDRGILLTIVWSMNAAVEWDDLCTQWGNCELFKHIYTHQWHLQHCLMESLFEELLFIINSNSYKYIHIIKVANLQWRKRNFSLFYFSPSFLLILFFKTHHTPGLSGHGFFFFFLAVGFWPLQLIWHLNLFKKWKVLATPMAQIHQAIFC